MALQTSTDTYRHISTLPPSMRLRALEASAAKEDLKFRSDFHAWLEHVTPQFTWDWPHLEYIRHYLDKITRGELRRLIISIPPRHGKSSMVTVRYPAWLLERNPSMDIIIAAYNQNLANRFSRQIRNIVGLRVPLDKERQATPDWGTKAGGGVRAVGVGGGITGHGGNCIIIDDPVKNREEANSANSRNKVWEWFTDDLYTRLEPNAPLILIATRWHNDDLSGRILESDFGADWEEIMLPALAEENDPLGREEGEALCPDRYDEEALLKRKTVLGRSFYALFQQTPQEREGEMFKWSWFEQVQELPTTEGAVFVRYWDKAGTKDDNAYTAGVLMALVDRTYYVVDVAMGQWSVADREKNMLATARNDRITYGHVNHYIEQEPGSAGKESVENSIKNLAGFPAEADRPTGDKIARAEPFASQCAVGNVKILKRQWTRQYLDILTAFPYGAIKDPVDASSGAFAKLEPFVVDWDVLLELGRWDEEESFAARWRI